MYNPVNSESPVTKQVNLHLSYIAYCDYMKLFTWYNGLKVT